MSSGATGQMMMMKLQHSIKFPLSFFWFVSNGRILIKVEQLNRKNKYNNSIILSYIFFPSIRHTQCDCYRAECYIQEGEKRKWWIFMTIYQGAISTFCRRRLPIVHMRCVGVIRCRQTTAERFTLGVKINIFFIELLWRTRKSVFCHRHQDLCLCSRLGRKFLLFPNISEGLQAATVELQWSSADQWVKLQLVPAPRHSRIFTMSPQHFPFTRVESLLSHSLSLLNIFRWELEKRSEHTTSQWTRKGNFYWMFVPLSLRSVDRLKGEQTTNF